MKKKWITAPLASLALSACGGGAEELPVEEPPPEEETDAMIWQSKVYRLSQVGTCERVSEPTDFVEKFGCDVEVVGAQGLELPMKGDGRWYVRYASKSSPGHTPFYQEGTGVKPSPEVLELSGVVTLTFTLINSTDSFGGGEACWSFNELTPAFFERDRIKRWCVELQ